MKLMKECMGLGSPFVPNGPTHRQQHTRTWSLLDERNRLFISRVKTKEFKFVFMNGLVFSLIFDQPSQDCFEVSSIDTYSVHFDTFLPSLPCMIDEDLCSLHASTPAIKD